MQNPHFPHFFNDAKDDKVVADRISAIPHASEDGITAKFMCGGKFLKIRIAPFNTVRKLCRSLWIHQFVGDVIEWGLKRIVTGMKREMQAYLAGGGTVEGYLTELEKRQRLEISYRDNAERRLNDMLNGQDARSPSATAGPANGQDSRSSVGRGSLKAAYAYYVAEGEAVGAGAAFWVCSPTAGTLTFSK